MLQNIDHTGRELHVLGVRKQLQAKDLPVLPNQESKKGHR